MTKLFLVTVAALLLIDTVVETTNVSCLVMRPGFGLVSEECPPTAIGCRIKASKQLIEWYELSRLYDRNQLVCVYPEEYKTLTGCMKKPSGSIRCWCGGRSDCNDPETSRDLYQAYTTGDNLMVEEISDWIQKSQKGDVRQLKATMITSTFRPKKMTATSKKTTMARKTTTTTTTTKAKIATVPSLSSIGLDPTFDAARKKLEEEMKEEDERLKQMLSDEENEHLSEDLTAEDQRELEREKYRMERRRAEQKQEDDILKRIEEEEMHVDEDDDQDEVPSNELRDFQNTSSLHFSLLFVLLIMI